MQNLTFQATLAAGAAALAIAGATLPAEAAGLTCSSALSLKVTPNIGCQIGSTNNDTVGAGNLQVNTDSLFGFTDWKFAGKDETGGTLNISSQFPNTSTTSGTWDISSIVQPSWTNLMLVFKGGNGNNISPEAYVGYLLTSTTGTWFSPFTNTKNGNLADVSHISLYYREIPTPALLPGLIGMGLAALRKRKGETAEVISEQ